jgi:hypothetical protein
MASCSECMLNAVLTMPKASARNCRAENNYINTYIYYRGLCRIFYSINRGRERVMKLLAPNSS